MKNTKTLTRVALLVAIELVMKMVGLGSVPVGPLYMSFLTLPIAVGAITMGPAVGALLGGVFGAVMTEGGGVINGREYSQHAMERMAPDTPTVRAELSRRAEKAAQQKGLEVGTKEYYEYCTKYVDPRNIPPSVIEDAISSSKAIPGNRPDTFIHETLDVKVVINSNGKVITVIPK